MKTGNSQSAFEVFERCDEIFERKNPKIKTCIGLILFSQKNYLNAFDYFSQINQKTSLIKTYRINLV
jgi:hypothetical protein